MRELADTGLALSILPRFAKLIPEVRSNLALALPFAASNEDVAAFSGRITCTRWGEVILAGGPEFGASSHMARVVLAARKVNSRLSCALNIACNESTVGAVKRAGLTIARFNRAEEPELDREIAGGTMDWGTITALERHKTPGAVDAVIDAGGMGKEPMIRLLAEDSREMLGKVRRILDIL